MRVIKGNTAKYVSFHKSLPTINRGFGGSTVGTPDQSAADSALDNNTKEIFEDILSFVSLLNTAESIQKINHLVYNAIRNHIGFVEADFFLFDTNNTELVSPDNSATGESNRFINNAYKEGILDWAFNSKSPRSIPVYNIYSLQDTQGQCLIIPLFEGIIPKGIFSIIYNTVIEKDSNAINYIQLIVSYAFQRISLFQKNEETKLAYNSLQAYQSKLSNDYRLFAVGELAGGVLEEILDPLQVIFSSVDLLHTNNGNKEIISSIKNQVRKIESSADRLRKFADRNGYAVMKILPCDLNKIIENYYSIISSSLEKKQIECILDLEEGLPSVLTHSDLINQMMVNIFSMITADFTRPGGVLIQTQQVKDVIKLIFITTEVVTALNKNSNSEDPNYKIITQLVNKHEGQIDISSSIESGSRIEIKFPLKRKIRS
ncbi:MAG: HAMP domain-containing sensor histidine kinase [Ignavibacteriaceae bacterium]